MSPRGPPEGAHSLSEGQARSAKGAPVSDAELHYDPVAIAAHWLLALLIFANLSLGLYMHDLPISPARLKLFNWHKWAGITILVLSALRLLWRLRHAPPPDAPMPPWQSAAAHTVHRLLYLLFFAVPLAGWAYSSASGFPVVWFGVLPLPDWVPVDRAWAAVLKATHKTLAITLGVLVLLHLAAALKHQFIDRDGLLRRMRPRWR
jgi:cytochrome b561